MGLFHHLLDVLPEHKRFEIPLAKDNYKLLEIFSSFHHKPDEQHVTAIEGVYATCGNEDTGLFRTG